MINITADRDNILERLTQLNENKQPIFGKMTPQHMIEHLALTVQFSNGKKPIRLYVSAERANRNKHAIIYTEQPMPVGYKAPMLRDELLPLINADIKTAIDYLKNELRDFDDYFNSNKEAKPVQPVMGKLDYAEWIIFHSKHFMHHFKQFELL